MRISWVVLLAGALVAGSGCRQGPVAPDGASADAWSKLIVGHTSGVVSRHGEIRVLFANDVSLAADPKRNPALTVVPATGGEVALRGPRELVLVPEKGLKPGQEYRVTLSASGLAGVPQGIEPYRFGFHVQMPQYDLMLADLESDPQDDARMIQRGTITTADKEEGEAVERLLRASYADASVAATWTHSGDGHEHGFTLAAVERQRTAAALRVEIDARPIGADAGETRTVEVPALGDLAVLNAAALEEEGRKQIQLTFTDRLDESQDLKGLVRLSSGVEFTTRIDGNRLTLYPPEELAGEVTVTLEPGIRNRRGERLKETSTHVLSITSEKPQVRFVGNGVILPDAKQMTVPFEAVSARSVQVVATRIYPENIAQFLQVNRIGGNYEIGRTGRYLWRKTLALPGPRTGRWQRYEIDVTELMQRYPGSLLQLTLQLTPADSAYACPGGEELRSTAAGTGRLIDQENSESYMQASWDYSAEYFGVAEDEGYDYQARWRDRRDPCRNAYYLQGYNPGTQAQRNLIVSNLGLLAKADKRGQLLVGVTNLATAQPVSGVSLQLRNYQNQPVGGGSTDGNGMATLTPEGTAFLLVAENGRDRGYLRLNPAGALPVSHFEVGGQTLQNGLKGAIYAERGVWRPGDPIPLTFVVHDREKTLPENHPATLELVDPRGRVAQTIVNASPVDGFYRFDARTAADAPTGNWTARVSLGGTSYSRALKVETVMPNRLKVALDLGQELLGGGRPLAGRIESQWLSGATASGLKADVKLRFSTVRTRFNGFDDYVFDDPARDFRADEEEVFAGQLDANGAVRFGKALDPGRSAPGMLSASFTTRVFERGGAFSIQYDTREYAPYGRFVGLKLPPGRHGTLPVDEEHTAELVALGAQGTPAPGRRLSLRLYKIDWRWWWDRGQESFASFVAREANTLMREGTVTTDAQGRASWQFRVGKSMWGRYLLRACDEDGGHCTGSVFYLDWPYWVGEGREMTGPAATMLELTADKDSYQAGETAVIQLPQSAQGRALVTVENGSAVLAARWVIPSQQDFRVSIPITAAMTPNAYVAVTLIQPHAGKNNDRPIRLYGVIPLLVNDPATQLKPVLQAAEEWRPESEVAVKVSEGNGRPMTYTLAVVDEGLLSLTNFRTPDLHGEFFRREALGVRTWDLFDEVSGAYGTALERLLALGGSDAGTGNAANQQQSRFPPVAQVLGPFQLPAGRTQEQKIRLPRYVGAVRVMVVAGSGKGGPAAYGSTEKSVPVRQPLMILPTLPRVVGPGEEITVPVSVFAMNERIRDVQLRIEPDAMFEVVGEPVTRLRFESTGEQIGLLRLRAVQRLGNARVGFTATSGNERATDEINIEVRSPNPPSTRLISHLLQPGESWTAEVRPHGIAGTNRVTLEVSRLPPVNLERRLGYLIGYPHGCLEQVTSAVFPQLFLSSLQHLDADALRMTEVNVKAGIERLGAFQLGSGAFSYWPGGSFEVRDGYHHWSAIYASHFLVEAEKKGYGVPAALRAGMIRSLRATAQSWRPTDSPPLTQAYRLYVLARAGQPEVGAMNRLREGRLDGVERWVLAAAYQLAGLADAARQLGSGDPLAVREYRIGDFTFGSPLRDHALVLQSLVILGQLDRAEPLVREVSKALSSDGWYSTQETAYALLAMSQLAGASFKDVDELKFARTLAGRTQNLTAPGALHREVLAGFPDAGADLTLRNSSEGIQFATVTVRGMPAAELEEAAASGLALTVRYSDAGGNPVSLDRIRQGEDVTVDIQLANNTRLPVANIALTQVVPSGWEIRNDRLNDSDDARGERGPLYAAQQQGARRGPGADYVDIRDDRVMQYFSLGPGQSIYFQTRINAAYRGRYYLPGIVAEAMYDANTHARTAGRWTEVVAQ